MDTGKFRSRNVRVAAKRDFPPGCGTGLIPSLKGSSGVKFVHNFTRVFPPGCGTNTPKVTEICPKKRLASEKDSGNSSDSSYWRRRVAAVKSKPPLGAEMVVKNPRLVKGKESGGPEERKQGIKGQLGAKMVVKNLQLVKGRELVGLGERKQRNMVPLDARMLVKSPQMSEERNKVLEMLKLFRERCERIARTEKGIKRIDVRANSELKNEGKIVNQNALKIGSVPGVEVGDRFHYRIELVIVGLHRLLQGGIDSMEIGGQKLATCIVANEGHFDKMNDPNVLIYVGEGGTLSRHEIGVPPDQQLKGGNRALWNSKKEKKPVRVVRGLKLDVSRPQKIVYVYDGLYRVEGCEKKKGPQGNMIFEFQLVREPGQTTVPWKTCRWGRF